MLPPAAEPGCSVSVIRIGRQDGYVLRLTAIVTMRPDQVPEAVRRGQELLAQDPDVITGEVGRCMPVRAGMPTASYVLTATFADRAAFDRYAASDEHQELLAWALPRMLDEQVVLHEVAPCCD